ncbi:MAG: 2,3-diphosphoglycerate-dependent phosphoglycerate mutase [Pseudomonadota bacterium]|nr:2,3-diphosphoglycerate-dependent phosphoglycerate mutase [Pseudomonadota bacterium]
MTNSNTQKTGTLVLVRHGQSEWNLKNLFTGWTDVDLTKQGIEEARAAGQLLKSEGLTFDLAFTSVLTRAVRTLWLILDEMDLMWIPVERDWRLNERHYGELQGLNKAETTAQHGAEQVKIWRRSYDIPPPALSDDDSRHPKNDHRYHGLDVAQLPGAESLKTTLDRVRPCWEELIAPNLKKGRNVLIAAHGNSLRALAKMLEDISEQSITEFNIPTGVPRIYELDINLQPLRAEYLGDSAVIAAAAKEIANQAN